MRTKRQRTRGQSLAEFGLVLPILLLVMMGIVDFGRAVFAYNTLSNAAREGARVAIVDQTVAAGISAAATEAANQAVGLGVDPATDVDVVYEKPDGTPCPAHSLGCTAEVTVRNEYRAITPIIGNIIGPIDLESSTILTIEFTKP